MGGDRVDKRYFVIDVEGQELPHAVVRVSSAVEEAFTHDLAWTPADLLSRIPGEPGWTARELEAPYAMGELVQMVDRVRWARYDSELAEFKYYAVFGSATDVVDLDKAFMLIRRSEANNEEKYDGDNRWVYTDKLHRLGIGRDWTDEYVAISAAEAAHLMRRRDRVQAENFRHYVVIADDRPCAVVRVSKKRDNESAFTGGDKWSASDLLSTARKVQEITWERSVEYMAELTQRQRDADRSGGYAVFHKLTDVLDLDSAYAVVQELEPEHRFSVRLTSYETERLAERAFLRHAKRNAKPVDGHYYFAAFSSMQQMSDLGLAHSVLRCGADGSTWEMFLREGEWPRALKPSRTHTLPIGRADVALITRRLSATESRFFEIRCTERGPVALIQLTGDTEVSTEDLRWQPTANLLRRCRAEPTWRISEETQDGMDSRRFWAAELPRAVAARKKSDEYTYVAVFGSAADGLALRNLIAVVRRRKDGVDEEFTRPGGWVPTDRLRTTTAHAPIHKLTLTPEEAARLTGS